MEINLRNIEEIIFFNKDAQAVLPEFRQQFDQWQLAYRIPGLKALGQRSVLEVLNTLEERHLKSLESYFGEPVLMQRLNHKLVDHYNCSIEEANRLCEFTEYKDFCIHRNKDKLSITFWR